jgi:hypothetical protein
MAPKLGDVTAMFNPSCAAPHAHGKNAIWLYPAAETTSENGLRSPTGTRSQLAKSKLAQY